MAEKSNEYVDAINQRFNDSSLEFKDAIKRLDEYAAFVKEYLPHQNHPDGRLVYSRTTRVAGIEVGIAGFNSSWSVSALRMIERFGWPLSGSSML